MRSMNASCLVYSHKNVMVQLRIFKLHRKMVLQQTPSSDTPTSGAPIFFSFILFLFLLGMVVALEKQNMGFLGMQHIIYILLHPVGGF